MPSQERGVLIVLIKTELQLTHSPEVPGKRAAVTVDLDAVCALFAD
jgi:hypothetical protein